MSVTEREQRDEAERVREIVRRRVTGPADANIDPYRPLPILAFTDEAIDSFCNALGYLTGESTKLRTGDDTGYAARITHVVRGLWADTDAFLKDLSGDVLTVQPMDDNGAPIGGQLAIPLNEIQRVTIL